jgi:iron complex outermembrane receptor protein
VQWKDTGNLFSGSFHPVLNHLLSRLQDLEASLALVFATTLQIRTSVSGRLSVMKLLLVLTLFVVSSREGKAQAQQGTLIVEVRAGSQPATDVEIVVGGRITGTTDERGEATIRLPIGEVDITAQRSGFTTETVRISIAESTVTRITIDLEPEILQQEITVTATTRVEQRIEDAPLRVEVLEQEEIEEKALMTPGDIAMLLNETGGLRVQVTSPSLGAANIRVQGLRGRYTQLLADGLPLYGGQTGAVGLLQIPPLDLARVEVIKGVASALYGSSALGGVINLISRRPEQAEHEFLLNQTTRKGTDAVLWVAEPITDRWRYTTLGGMHLQQRRDIDGDGWADMAGYRRGTLRPRFSWENGTGKSVFVTAGAMIEDRKGGTIGNATVPDGNHFPEQLTTRRFDAGIIGRFLLGEVVASFRGSGMTQRHEHVFGFVVERDRHHTLFGEAAVSGAIGAHTWAIGSALQTDLYRSRDVSRFDYTYTVPAVFAQDDYALNSILTVSGSARVDFHSDYGTVFNPRVSALFRLPDSLTVRLSSGTGVFAPTPFTEQTEAVGLTRLAELTNLDAERAFSASADVAWSAGTMEFNGSFFGSVIRDPIMLRLRLTGPESLQIINAETPTRTIGSEFLARLRRGNVGVTFSHTFIQSRESDPAGTGRRDVPLTPRHAVGVVGMWEKEESGRVGIEVFYTGGQYLEDNPYRDTSRPYWIVGLLAERKVGPIRLFINGENLTNTRQTRHDKLVRPERHPDGRWTVDAWAPLEGRVINGGIRLSF